MSVDLTEKNCLKKSGESVFAQFPQCEVWKNEKFSLTENVFRQITYLVISLVKCYFHEISAKKE